MSWGVFTFRGSSAALSSRFRHNPWRMRPLQQLPNYVRAYRKRSGLSQEDLAFAVKLSSKSEVSQLERFRCEPSYRLAVSCAKALGVPTDELFAGINASAGKATDRRMRTLQSRLVAKAAVAGCLRRIAHKIEWIGQHLGEMMPKVSIP